MVKGYGCRALIAAPFGVRLVSDIPERFCELGLRPPLNARRRQRLEAIRRAGRLFIHVPKSGGMSSSQALYGLQVKHASIRYYRAAAPDIGALPSFAFIREPVDRFRSAYAYAKAGGGADNRVSPPFRDRYMGFRGVDEALDHIEALAAEPYGLDHIFRPQSWYITDLAGRRAIDALHPFSDIGRMTGHVRLNRGIGAKPALSTSQMERVTALYARDVALHRKAVIGSAHQRLSTQ